MSYPSEYFHDFIEKTRHELTKLWKDFEPSIEAAHQAIFDELRKPWAKREMKDAEDRFLKMNPSSAMADAVLNALGAELDVFANRLREAAPGESPRVGIAAVFKIIIHSLKDILDLSPMLKAALTVLDEWFELGAARKEVPKQLKADSRTSEVENAEAQSRTEQQQEDDLGGGGRKYFFDENKPST